MWELTLRALVFAALVALAFVPLEGLLPARTPGRTRTQLRTDLAFATIGQVITRALIALGAGVLLVRLDDLAYRLWPDGLVAESGLWQVLLGLCVFELGGYAYHRMAHRVPLLWRLHRVHHSSREMDWLAAFRQHPLEIALMTLFQNAPLVLLGIPFGAHATVVVLLRLHTVLLHANLRLPQGPWEQLIALPRFHQRHHALHDDSKNFSSMFPWLDRCFGTYSDESASEFGVKERMPESFVGLLLGAVVPASPLGNLPSPPLSHRHASRQPDASTHRPR